MMDLDLLWEPPFTDRHPDGIDGAFGDEDAGKIVGIIKSVNANTSPRDAA